MNRSIIKGVVLAAALTIGAPAAWAANTATPAVATTATSLPPSTSQPVAPVTEPEVTEAVAPYMPAPQVQAVAAPAAVASWIVYTALGVGILALLIGIGLSVFAYAAYRSLNDYVVGYDDANERHSAQLKQQDLAIREMSRELSNVSSLVVINQRETRKSQSAYDSDWANGSPQASAPSAPPPPQQASSREVAALLDAYRQVLSAKSPDQLAAFREAYQPTSLSVTADHIGEAHDGDDNVWLITKPHWGGEGIVLPGSHAIRAWGTTFQPSGGRAAQNQFGPIYTVLPGNVLEIEEPARVTQYSNGDIRLTGKGTLRGA